MPPSTKLLPRTRAAKSLLTRSCSGNDFEPQSLTRFTLLNRRFNASTRLAERSRRSLPIQALFTLYIEALARSLEQLFRAAVRTESLRRKRYAAYDKKKARIRARLQPCRKLLKLDSASAAGVEPLS